MADVERVYEVREVTRVATTWLCVASSREEAIQRVLAEEVAGDHSQPEPVRAITVRDVRWLRDEKPEQYR